MQYKKNWIQVLDRLTELYTLKGKNRIYAKMNIPNPFINEYVEIKSKEKGSDEEIGYPDIEQRISFWDKALSIYRDLEDDSIPSCYLSEFDEGLYGGLVDGEVRFLYNTSPGWVSSMTIPFVKDLDEVRGFKINENHNWFKLYKKQMELYIEKSRGKFGISHFILITGLNFLFEIKGATETFFEVIENPQKVKFAIDFSIKLNAWVQDTFFKTVGLLNGGTCSPFSQWIPGRIVCESVDPFHMTSPDLFEEWGRGAIQKMFDHFDGGILHLHSNGYHLIKNVISLRGLKSIFIIDEDFNTPAYKKLSEIDSLRGDIPIIVSIPCNIFLEKLFKKDLPTNILYNVLNVPDIKTSNEIMCEVRNYINI